MKKIFIAIITLCTLSNLSLNAKTFTVLFKSHETSGNFMAWLVKGKNSFKFESYQTLNGIDKVTYTGDELNLMKIIFGDTVDISLKTINLLSAILPTVAFDSISN